jgi:hypothetical protein
MSSAAYDNMEFVGASLEVDKPAEEDDDDVVMSHLRDRQLDSLDANVLNDSLDDHNVDFEDAGYEASHMSNGGSTLRVGSYDAYHAESTRSASSGFGDTSRSRRRKLDTLGRTSGFATISALFPSQMPPVEKLGYGQTIYDEDDVPRTEL